jgi:hypothetical protein
LYQKSTLARLNSSFSASASWEQRKIPDFPVRAMSLKTIWWPAFGDQPTRIPVWNDSPATHSPSDEDENGWMNWKREVAVDMTRQYVPPGETTRIRGSQNPLDVVGRDRFYAFQVTMDNIDSLNRSIREDDTGNLPNFLQFAIDRDHFVVGDYLLFLGFHFTSKEINDWTWSTLWWHDKPDAGPFAADRPQEVTGVWRNYLMTIADDEVTPHESDGSPRAAFNPWLEGGFANGTLSNCMNCHHRASYPRRAPRQSGGRDFLPVRRGPPDPATDPALRPGRLQLDFLWSILDRSR